MSTTRSKLGVIFLTVFIDLVGFGLVVPILPYFAQRFGANGLGYGAIIGIFSLMQFLSTMVLGRLSDRVGRRPVLLLTMVVACGGYVLFASAGSYLALFLARLIAGLASGNISVAQAYIADVTAPSERSKGMALVGVAFGLGFIVGPALGGVVGHIGGPAAVGLVAAGLCALNFVSTYFILDESLHHTLRRTKPLLDFAHLAHGLRDAKLGPPFLVFAVIPFAFGGYMIALPLYANARFNWGAKELGIFFSAFGAVVAVIQGYGFGKLAARFGDRRLAIFGTFAMAFPFAAVPFLHTGMALYVSAVFLAFANSLVGPALTGLISRLAGPDEQGAMLGAAQGLSALGRFSGPFVFGAVYDKSALWTFLLTGLLMLVAGVISTRMVDEPVLQGREKGEGGSEMAV
jgi:MFS family permease